VHRVLGIGMLDQPRRVADVGEEDRELLAFAAGGAERPQQIFRWPARGSVERRAAFAAEPAGGAVDMAARRAHDLQRLSAGFAECIRRIVVAIAVSAKHTRDLDASVPRTGYRGTTDVAMVKLRGAVISPGYRLVNGIMIGFGLSTSWAESAVMAPLAASFANTTNTGNMVPNAGTRNTNFRSSIGINCQLFP
jgi:hypothetical protein